MILSRDTLTAFRQADAPLYAAPKSLQEAIEIKNVYEDGVFEVGNGKFSKTYFFYDINYATAGPEEQEAVFEKYCGLLNSLDVSYKITINNRHRDMEAFRRDILIREKGDGLDPVRREMNSIVEGKLRESRQGIEQERYLTVTVERKDVEAARQLFANIEMNLEREFAELGSELKALDGSERLHILYDFYHLGREDDCRMKKNYFPEPYADFRNDLCNGMLQFYPDHFEDEGKWGAVLFIKKYPNSLSDRFLNEIMGLPAHIMTSIDVVPIPKDVTVKILQNKYIGIEKDISNQQQARNRNHDFASEISYAKRKEKEGIEQIMKAVGDNDRCMFYVGVTILVTAGSKTELNSIIESIMTIGKRSSCMIGRHFLMQREAMNTALPIGVRQVETMRTLLTDSLAVLMPFNSGELCERGGQYYGQNRVSKNLCIGNRKRLVNGNGFNLSVPGGGKSFFSKMEIFNVLLTTDDDVIVIDPQNEHTDDVVEMNGTMINFSATSPNRVNALDIDTDMLTPNDANGVIREKTGYVLGICEQCMGKMVDVRVKSIVTRCVRMLYDGLAEKLEKGEQVSMPVMTDLCELLKEQPEKEAQDIALALELFKFGELSIFNEQTNVDVNNRFTVYGLRDMGEELAPVSMLIMMENISRRIAENAKHGKATWLYIDEMHVLLGKEYTAKYLFDLWKKVRKLGGLCTGITQNVTDLLQNYTAQTMLSNSEFVVMLRQSSSDAKELERLLNIPEAQMRFVRNSESGTGLIKHGNLVVPFDIRVGKDTGMYKRFNTDAHKVDAKV